LKIDVEKAELEVLLGIEEQQWSKIQQIVIEVHDKNNRVQTISQLLIDKGFQITTGVNENMTETDMVTMYATKKTNAISPTYTPDELKWHTKDALKKSIHQYIEKNNLIPPNHYFFTHDLNAIHNLAKINHDILVSRQPKTVEASDETVTDTLKKIWCDLLEIDHSNINDDDDFFSSGGDSLKAVFLIVDLEKAFGDDILPPEELFESSTFGHIKQIILAKV